MKKVNGYKLIKRGIVLAAVPIVLAGCSKDKNPNTTSKIISESIISDSITEQSETTTLTTDSETAILTAGVESTTIVTDAVKTTTTTEAKKDELTYGLLTADEYELFSNANKYEKTISEWLDLIGKGHDIEQVNQIWRVILDSSKQRGETGYSGLTYNTAALIAQKCVSEEMIKLVKDALETSHVNEIDNINLSDEEKEKYIFINKLYNAYISAADNKNAYLMINNGGKIFDSMKNLDALLLKNKITSEERLNYFISYTDGEVKDPNLLLGESLLQNYFEEMKWYVTEKNSTEFINWTSTTFSIENIFAMLEEQFRVEKINGKYVALKIEENVITTNPVVTEFTTIETTSLPETTLVTTTTTVLPVEQQGITDYYQAPNTEYWTTEDEYLAWYGIEKQESASQQKIR